MRSLVTLSFLVVFALGCDAAEPAKGEPAPAPSEGVTPASPASPTPTPPASVFAAPLVPLPPPAPTPVDVCRHVRDVASKNQPAANVLDEVERDCIVALERVRKQYDTLASCLLNTSLELDVAACEHSMRSWTDLLSKADPKPTGLEVCTHLMDLMKRELGDGVGPSDEDITKYTQQCVEDLEKQQEKVSAEQFDAQITCVMAATKMEELASCEKTTESERAE